MGPSENARDLLELIIRDPDNVAVGELANQLLKAIQSGFPAEAITAMLRSSDDRVVERGIWIASELGYLGIPLTNDVLLLLGNRSKKVRFFAIDALLGWLSISDGREVQAIIQLADDSEDAVRWKVLYFMSFISLEHLRSALEYLRRTGSNPDHVEGLGWLTSEDSTNVTEIVARLGSSEGLKRKYAVVAAVRLARERGEMAALLRAAELVDADVSRFASDMMKIVDMRRN